MTNYQMTDHRLPDAAPVSRRRPPDIADKLDAGVRLTSTTASACSMRPICWPSAGSPTASARRGTARAPTTTTTSGSRRPTSASRAVCSARSRGCKPGDPGAYTMSLEEAWDKLRQRGASAAHRSPRRQRPAPGSAVRLLHGAAARLQADPAGHPPEVLHRGRDRVLRRPLRHDRRAGAARADGGRASTRCRAAAPRSSPSACAGRSRTTSAAPSAISRFIGPRTASACART